MTPTTNALPNRTGIAWSGRLVRVMIIASLLLTYLVVKSTDQAALGETGGTTALREIDPFRLVDTRIDLGVDRLDANTYKVRTRYDGAIPEGAEALAVSIVVTGAQAPGHLVAYPASEDRELASTMTYEAGQTTSTGAVITLNEWANFEIYTLTPVDVIIDVTGAFVSAATSRSGRFVPVTPDRVVDTRDTTPMTAGQTTTIQLPSAVPADAIAAIVTLTSTLPNQPGYFTAFPDGPRPLTSTLNVATPNSTRASTAIVPIANRNMRVYSSGGGNLVVDLVGYFTGPSAERSTNGLFVPTSPKRRLDTRDSATMATGETRGFDVSGGVALGSLTMVGQGAGGHAVLFANGTRLPETSAINLSDTQVISNMAVSATSEQRRQHPFGDRIGLCVRPVRLLRRRSGLHHRPDRADRSESACAGNAESGTPTAPAAGRADAILVIRLFGVERCWCRRVACGSVRRHRLATDRTTTPGVSRNTRPSPRTRPTSCTSTTPARRSSRRSEAIALSERPGKQRSLLLINWKPSGKLTWRQVANGGADADIAKVAANVKKYPHKFFLNIFHEPEDNVKTSSSSGMTAKDYADMYRHVVTELRGHGVTNAVYVWNMMGYSGWEQYLDDLYPGDAYVDWLAYDPYAKDNRFPDVASVINRSRSDINWPGYYEWVTAKAPGKPIMLAEWGVDLKSNSDPASVLRGDMTKQLAEYPMVKALVYWNEHGVGNYRIDEQTSKGIALGAAYRAMAAQPIFNAMTPNSAP